MTPEVLLKRLYPWGDFKFICILEGGYRNQVFLLEQAGKRFVTKTTRRSEAALNWLEPVHLVAEKVGFMVPKLIATSQGYLTVNGLTLEPFIEGETPLATQLADFEAQLKLFHDLSKFLLQRPDFASSLELLHQTKGGDVDLTAMPAVLVNQCREIWATYKDEPTAVIHGDINLNNLLLTAEGKIALLDWDEARVDLRLFDSLALRKALGQVLNSSELALLNAWEVAVCWLVEPEHARTLAARLGEKTNLPE